MEIFEDNSDIPYNILIDSLLRAMTDLNKFFVESKAIIDARWTKAMEDLEEVRTIEWTTKRDIYFWEAVGEIKALPPG